jgi:hypothetical protein
VETTALHSPLWGGLVLLAAAVALVSLAALHALPTGLAPMSTAVSEYGISRYRLGYRVLTVSMGVAGLAAAAGVAATFPSRDRMAVIVLLVIFGACRLVISWVPMDEPGAGPPTSTGVAHALLAIVTFVSAALAASRMHRAVNRIGGLAGYDTALRVAVWVTAVGIVGMLLVRRTPLHRWFGAVERLVYVGIFVLLFATGSLLV